MHLVVLEISTEIMPRVGREDGIENLVNKPLRTEQESRLKWFFAFISIPLFTTGAPGIEVNHIVLRGLQYFILYLSLWVFADMLLRRICHVQVVKVV